MGLSKLELAVGTGQWDAGLKKAQQALNNFTQSQGGFQKALDKDNGEIQKFIQMMAKMDSTANTSRGQMNDYKRVMEQLTAQYNQMSDAQKRSIGQDYLRTVDALKQKFQAAKQQVDEFNRSIGDIKAPQMKGGGMDQLMSGVAGQFGLGAGIATGAGAALATVGIAYKTVGDNIRTAMNFEKSMSGLSALTGMVGKDLDTLKEYAIELGSTTTLTASQVADAFRLIGSQQPQLLSSAEALKEVTKYAITLSEAAGIDLATASQTLSTSINQMGGDSANAARYVNVLAAASQKGAGDIAWLGEAVVKSGTYAKAVGASYEDLVANLETLAKAGYDASTAGTALRSIILALEKQADSDLKPSVVGLTEAFENLGTKQLDISGYAALVNQRFAAQAMTLAENAQQTRDMTEAITGTNIAEQQAETNVNNLNGALKQLESAWEGLNLHINDSNSLLTPLVNGLAETVRQVDSLVTKFMDLKAELEKHPLFQLIELMSSKTLQFNIPGMPGVTLLKQGLNLVSPDPAKQQGSQPRQNYGEFQNPLSADRFNLVKDLQEQEKGWGGVATGIGNATEGMVVFGQQANVVQNALKELEDDTNKETKSIKELENEIKSLKKLRDDAANKGNTELRDQYNKQIKAAQAELKALRGGATPTPRGSKAQTPQDKADNIVKNAEEAYAQTMKEASLRMEAGLDDSLAYKKKELQAQEQLFGAYGRAYAVYADPKYKDAYDAAAAAYQKMAGEVASTADEQAKAKEAAKALAAAEKRLADAQEKLAAAEASGNLKDIQTARKAVTEATTDLSKLNGANTKVVYTVEVSGDELNTLQQKLQALGDETIKVDVEGDTDDVQLKLHELYEEPGTVTVKIEADTADAVSAVDSMVEGMEAKRVVVPVVGGESSEHLVKVKFTDSNMSAFVKGMKDELANAELGSALYNSLTSQIADATMLGNLMQTAVKNGIDVAQFDPQALWSKIFQGSPGDYIDDADWQALVDRINEQLKEMDIEPLTIDVKTGDVKGLSTDAKSVEKSFQAAASAVQSVGSALQGLQDPGAKVAGIVAQAIAQIALGFAQATAASSGAGIFGWIAAIAGGLATMTSTIAAIKTATAGSYAEGGIVPGNSFSGDKLTANVNSGELILNRAQQNSIAAQLDGVSTNSERSSTPYVNGEQIWLGLSNYLKRSGRGEIVTSRGK